MLDERAPPTEEEYNLKRLIICTRWSAISTAGGSQAANLKCLEKKGGVQG